MKTKLLSTNEVLEVLNSCRLYPRHIEYKYQSYDENTKELTSQSVLAYFQDYIIEVYQNKDHDSGIWVRGEAYDYELVRLAIFVQELKKAEKVTEDDKQ